MKLIRYDFVSGKTIRRPQGTFVKIEYNQLMDIYKAILKGYTEDERTPYDDNFIGFRCVNCRSSWNPSDRYEPKDEWHEPDCIVLEAREMVND